MQKPTRFKAGLIHFSLSLSIFSIVFFILFTLWYPEPYFTASGGWQGLKIMASIDIVLGPLLTCVVFNPSKSVRELTFDLSIIASMQIAALVWGVYTVYQQRPAAVVYFNDSFYTVTATELTTQGYALENLQRYSDNRPPLIFIQHPTKVEDLQKSLALMKEKEIPMHIQTDLYQPLLAHFNEIRPFQMTETTLRQDPDSNAALQQFLSTSGLKMADLQCYLLQSKYQDMVLIFNAEGKIVGHVPKPKLAP